MGKFLHLEWQIYPALDLLPWFNKYKEEEITEYFFGWLCFQFRLWRYNGENPSNHT